MAEQLEPIGRTVEVDEVSITAPGLSGVVSVHYEGAAGLRAADMATPEFVAALERTGTREQLTVEIADPVEYPTEGTLTTRSTSTGEPGIALEVPGPGSDLGQVLLMSDEDGVLSWHLPDDIERAEVPSRGADRRTYTIPRRVITEPEGGSRGILGAIGKKVLKVLVFDLSDEILGAVGDFFVRRWEEKHRGHRLRGLVAGTIAKDDVPNLTVEDVRELGAGRALLFIHGTGSRSSSGLKRLPDPVFESLNKRYEGRVAGFDHPTIGFSPTENASWLAELLAEADTSLDVDIVAHSRGGLVARVLAEQPAAAGLDPARIRVSSTVFVATPNAGTALADFDHLGDLLDRLTNLLELVPDNPVTDPLEVILTVVKQLAVGAFKGLDGLTSMNPAGDYLKKCLNVSSSTEATYRAVASDFEPLGDAPLTRIARDAATDAIFSGAENDLVVPTAGVYSKNGGSRFPIPEPLIFDAAAAIDHSSYWAEPRLHDAFDEWLAG